MKRQTKRQTIRKGLILVSLLLFPITLDYFSPYLIMDGASLGVINGSAVVFGVQLLSALFLGRLWCGWACPGAGLQEAAAGVNGSRARGGRLDWIKWAIWIPWVGLIVAMAVSAGGYREVNVLHSMDSAISIDRPIRFAMYYTVVALLLGVALATGRRGACHYVCWMAPFTIIGRRLGNLARWPALRLRADASRCSNCRVCSRDCPMSLDVNHLVQSGSMEHDECILCGTCVDNCAKSAIRYSFSRPARRELQVVAALEPRP